jgi:fructokinase
MAPAILGVGEILWDLLPSGPQLGGAPFNFTFHCHQLGHSAVMVSRVGADERGAAIREAVHRFGLSGEFIQDDDTHPTGTVAVAVDERGQPTFTITPDVAYDFLAWKPELEALASRAQAVCFGTLVQRHDVARATLHNLLRSAVNALVVYDVNLRQHFYRQLDIEHSLRQCRWVKLNDQELTTVRDLLALAGMNESDLLADLRKRYDVELACLTRGANGCLVQTDDDEITAPGVPVTVVDTVGAGDAFTAALLCSLLDGKDLGTAVAFANRLAARVAASAGGTPLIGRDELEQLRRPV